MSKPTDNGDMARFTGQDADKTGQKRLGKNLLSLWSVELVVVISGFVIPRLIDSNLGQVQLGVWDLGWSIVSYFRFLGLGLSGALNRYVARYHVSGEVDKLKKYVSSGVALQIAMSAVTLICVSFAAYAAPMLVEDEYAELVTPVRWVVAFLGGTLAARMIAAPARGILTGRHLWTVNSTVNVVGDIGALLAMLIALMAGGGLRELAGSYFLATACTELCRYAVARHHYGRKLLHIPEIGMIEIKELFLFCMKENVALYLGLIVIQTLNIILALTAGPAALAVYARALALQRHTQALVNSFAMLLTSTAGSLQGLGRESQYKEFFINSMRMSLGLSVPLFLMLAIYGDIVVHIWMGKDYVDRGLLALMCAGVVFPASHSAAMRILIGLNAHGRPSVVAFVITLVMLGAGILVGYQVGWSSYFAASLMGVSLTFGTALPVVIIACRKFSVTFVEYLLKIVVRPLLANVPFTIVLVIGTAVTDPKSVWHNFFVLITAGTVLLASYWFLLIDPTKKAELLKKIDSFGRKRLRPGVTASANEKLV